MGNEDRAIFLLIVFQNGDDRPTHGHAGTIERMRIGWFASLGSKANIGSSRLKRFEVTARRDFPIGLLRRDPDFEIIRFGCTESQIAAAQADDPVR